ncbi:flavin-containing monooxygenase [Nocardioides taihuensis]|uniref:Flavin-containing monooxygenase n=1 Tax=Nocardioides taihuensis TaxID=1835606 RepID=A0ABW0BJN4_9ACTN
MNQHDALDVPDDLDAIVIGAGQAGLATAYHLRRRGLRFVVLDAGHEVGGSWRERWDSLRLFTPAEHDGLPGWAFPAPAGSHPTKDEVADYLASYAARFALPVLLEHPVERLERVDGTYVVHTPHGRLRAPQVVVATGPFQVPVVPAIASRLGPDVVSMHSSAYRNPASVPDGPVVVVGDGNSGRQIALELSATRDVTLSAGSPPLELPQRLLGRDLFWWLTRLGVVTRTADSPLARRMRERGDLVIGTPLRRLRRAGVDVRPRVVAATPDAVRFATGGVARPAAVVWATGFRTDHAWIDVPGVVESGRVVHERGRTPAPGLWFVGLPWQHTRGSSLLGFVQHDAAWVASHLTARSTSTITTSTTTREEVPA